jgi:hypothetical protein
MSRLPRAITLPLLLAGIVTPVHAQSINVDFGSGSAPAESYAAAGAAGRWNLIGVLQPYVRAPLVDVAGAPTAARIYMYGATQMLQADNPGTSGDDEALMDDMLIGLNDPVDECLWIESLAEDDYEVLIYAMTPDDPSRMCRVRVDDATPGPVNVGGTWPGAQQRGVTYERFVVHATGGLIAFHSGLYGGYFQSGMNGVQIRPLSAASVGSLGPAPGGARLHVVPNPSRETEPVEFALPSGLPRGRLELFDAGGRLLWASTLEPGVARRWDGRDRGGRQVPAGLVLARWSPLAKGAAPITQKIVRLR